MRYAFYFKLSSELIDDVPTFTACVKEKIADQNIKILRSSRRLMPPATMRMNLDGEDFTRCLTTVLITAQVYKIPRIVKKILLRQPPKICCDTPL